MNMELHNLISINEINKDFSKITRLVDEDKVAIISENNKPKYVVLDFEDYNNIITYEDNRAKLIDVMADKLIDDNLEAFMELAK